MVILLLIHVHNKNSEKKHYRGVNGLSS